MSKSRLALLLPLIAAPALAASGEPLTSEQAMEAYRETFRPVVAGKCKPGSDPDEIVVCGRPADARSPYRLPHPSATLGERGRGDMPTGMTAMSADKCMRLCHQPVMMDILAVPGFVVDLIDRLQDD